MQETINSKLDAKKLATTVFLLSFISFWANGDNYAVAPLIIDIASDFKIEISQAALSVTSYMLSFGLFTILFGPLGDRFGKVKIINIAALGTSIFSILGAFSFNLPSLMLVRALNGAFGAGIFPVTIALIGESFDSYKRQTAIGKVMGMMFLGGACATAIGGAIAYFGSWRIVYLVYGVAELILSLIMLKTLDKQPGVIDKLSIIKVYKEALSNKKLISVVATIFLIGFTVFGSFTYSGQFIKEKTGFNIMVVGLILSIYGIATIVGGRNASKIFKKIGNRFLLFAGILGSISLFILSISSSPIVIGIALFGFGLAFVSLQSTLVTTAQELMPKLRGTVMSLTSFNMFVGGAVGTSVNGYILRNYGVGNIFAAASIVMLVVGFVALSVMNNITKNK